MDSGPEYTSESRPPGDPRVDGAVAPKIALAPALQQDPRCQGFGFSCDAVPRDDAFLIGEHDGALDLRPPGEHDRRGIQAVFPPDKETPGRAAASSRRNPLIRAFGKRPIEVLDLTAGLGGDAYRLACAGHRVTAFERAAPVFVALASGWARARAHGLVPSDVAERLTFVRGEGLEAIASLARPAGGVYIDPMYPPPKRRSAKPRRELQVLRALLGGQTDAAELVRHARERAARVVVKRPHHAKPLVEGASFEVETKLVRFDVYLDPSKLEHARDE